MQDTSLASADRTQELTLLEDDVMAESANASHCSGLSLDDLSHEDSKRDDDDDNDVLLHAGDATKRMEAKLQTNLKQQQEHYARQRKLFEGLRAAPREAAPTCRAEASPDSSVSHTPQTTTTQSHRRDKRSHKFELQLLTGNTALSQQQVSARRSESTDGNGHHELARIKEKAMRDYQRRVAKIHHTRTTRATAGSPSSPSSSPGVAFLDELQQQEASNEALRKQLELLRRLQVENNRFRQENRTVREQNEVLEQQNAAHAREIRHLRTEVSSLSAKLQHAQANATQTGRDLAQAERRINTLESEKDSMQSALDEQLAAMGTMEKEIKRLKRHAKQSRVQETQLADDNALLKARIASLETEQTALQSGDKENRALNDRMDKENRALIDRVAELEEECNALEAELAASGDRVATVKNSYASEREKRKQIDVQRKELQEKVEVLAAQSERLQLEMNAQQSQLESDLEAQATKFHKAIRHLEERLHEAKSVNAQQLQRQKRDYELQEDRIAELLERQKQDTVTIQHLRTSCTRSDQQTTELQSSLSDAQREFSKAMQVARKDTEALRTYLGRCSNTDAGTEEPMEPSLPSDDWDSVAPEWQILQSAMGGLRADLLGFVHIWQKTRHGARQQTKHLAVAQRKIEELEQLRSEGSKRISALQNQCSLLEEAREIFEKEKRELIKWNEETCANKESLELEITKCDRFLHALRKKLVHRLRAHCHKQSGSIPPDRNSQHEREATEAASAVGGMNAKPLSNPFVSRLFGAVENEINAFLVAHEELAADIEQRKSVSDEQQHQLARLSDELASQSQEFHRMTSEMEMLHATNLKEQKRHLEKQLHALENERSKLADKLEIECRQVETLTKSKHELLRELNAFEQDMPVLATMLHLFAMVVQPMILQVSDLLHQKRFLARENAEYAHTHQQMECIGQVLRELVPTATRSHEHTAKRTCRARLRRVIIAVFALNRLRRCSGSGYDLTADDSTGDEVISPFGFCTSLKVPSKKRNHAALTHRYQATPATVIKILPVRETIARVSLRAALERLRNLEITQKIGTIVDADKRSVGRASSSLMGSLLLQVLVAIDPDAKDTLVENTSGVFHCEALLERRRYQPSKQHRSDATESVGSCGSAREDELGTVDFIRKRILALGKRVEDLHYQRNALQKDNYDFQFQLEQQASELRSMAALQENVDRLQEELEVLQKQRLEDHGEAEEALQAKELEVHAKEQEMVRVEATIEGLEEQMCELQSRVEAEESEKESLRSQVMSLQQRSLDSEERTHHAQVAIKKQDEELRHLRQAATKAHELYQKVHRQLEHEVAQKATLVTQIEHLTRQKQHLETEIHAEKMRDLDSNLSVDDAESDSSSSVAVEPDRRRQQPSRIPRKSGSDVGRQHIPKPRLEISDRRDYDSGLTSYERQRQDRSLLHQAASVRPSSPVHMASSSSRDEVDIENDDVAESDDHLGRHVYRQASLVAPLMAVSASALPGRKQRGHHVGFALSVPIDDDAESQASPPRHSSKRSINQSQSSFASEWRRMGLASAFTEDDKPSSSSSSWQHQSSEDPVAQQVAREVAIATNQRRIDIDKVNSAVHDYMDRIDEKLQHMYGIPPSCRPAAS